MLHGVNEVFEVLVFCHGQGALLRLCLRKAGHELAEFWGNLDSFLASHLIVRPFQHAYGLIHGVIFATVGVDLFKLLYEESQSCTVALGLREMEQVRMWWMEKRGNGHFWCDVSPSRWSEKWNSCRLPAKKNKKLSWEQIPDCIS